MAETVEIDIVANDKTSGIIQGIFQGIGQQIANFAMQIPGAIMDFGASILNEAMEAQTGMAQLEAVIKSTGGAAGMTAEELTKMADELSQVTRFSDDAIIGGENLLLTFTNIGQDVFPDATKAILDMSTAMNQDLKSSAIQLGKALNDPIEGIGALSRVGVQFTDEQKNMIESLVKMGDIAGAQKIILEELNKEFSGSAEAAGQTFAGQLDILKNSLNNVKEGIGMALLPVLNELGEKYLPIIMPMIESFGVKLAEWIPLLGPVIDRMMNVATAIWEFLQPAFQAIGEWWEANGTDIIFKATTLFDSLWVGIWKVIEAVKPFVEEALQMMADWWAENNPLIMDAVATLQQAFQDALPVIGQLLIDLQPLLLGVLDIFLQLVTMISQAINGDWSAAFQTMDEIVKTAAEAIGETILNLGGTLAEVLGFERNDIVSVWTDNWNQVKEIVRQVASIIEQTIDGVVSKIGELTEAMGDFSGIATGGLDAGAIFSGLLTGGAAQRAKGGPVAAGQSYLVGEQGAEIFRPSQSGAIIPNGGGGGGSINVTLQYSPSVALGNQYEAENVLLPFILQGIRAAQANGLVPVG